MGSKPKLNTNGSLNTYYILKVQERAKKINILEFDQLFGEVIFTKILVKIKNLIFFFNKMYLN